MFLCSETQLSSLSSVPGVLACSCNLRSCPLNSVGHETSDKCPQGHTPGAVPVLQQSRSLHQHRAVRDVPTQSLPRPSYLLPGPSRRIFTLHVRRLCSRGKRNLFLFLPRWHSQEDTFWYRDGSAPWPPGIGPFKKYLTEFLFYLLSIPKKELAFCFGPCSPFSSATCLTYYFYHTILTFNVCNSFEEVIITQTNHVIVTYLTLTVTMEFHKTQLL